MPAVMPDDLSKLPKLSSPQPGTHRARPVVSVTTAVPGLEGDGFPVRRAFAGVAVRALDPFVLLDQMGEINYAPGEPKGTPWHPHRGFETVTYMIDGETAHRDSTGGGGLISNGDTQWMTAGAGILHIERPPEDLVRTGGLFHGTQLWVNLPAAKKFTPPRYQEIPAARVGLAASPDGGALVRIIAGTLDGHAGPGVTHTPIALAHVTVAPSARVRLRWPATFNALGYVLNGQGAAGPAQHPVRTGQLAVFGAGDTIDLAAAPRQELDQRSLDVLLLGGRPIREPVVHYGPFVMNTPAEIRDAIDDYRAGRLGTIPPGLAGLDPHRSQA